MNVPANALLTSADRAREVRRVLFWILWLNFAVAIAKAVYGWWAGSLAVATDAVHSLLDGGANIIALVALKFASEPPDEKHPYGHARIEIIAALAIGVAIASGAVRFAWSAVDALVVGADAARTPGVGFAVIGATLAVNIVVATYEARRGRQLKSPLLLADASHTASDVAVTIGVLSSLVAVRLGLTWADPVAALAVVVVIGLTAVRIMSGAFQVLVDRVAVDRDRVAAIARSVVGVRGVHRIRSRGTPQATHIDMHIQLDRNMSLKRAHSIAHKVEAAVCDELEGIIDVTIHMEPDDDPPESL